MSRLGTLWVRHRRQILACAGVLVLSVALLLAARQLTTWEMTPRGDRVGAEIVTARVERVWTRDVQQLDLDGTILESVTVYFEATITSGPRKGSTVGAEQVGDPFTPIPMREVSPGDRINLRNHQRSPEEKVWVLQEYRRTGPLLVLGLVFVALLILFGGKKGVGTVFSLALTCMAIFLVLIPLILSGYNVYGVTLSVCLYIVLVTLVLVNGVNRKSLSAAMGCLGGLLVSGLLVRIMDGVLKLTGLLNEESAFIIYMNADNPLDIKALIFSGILIGALGAILDVAVSMASSLSELQAATPGMTFRQMVRSGFNIGRDILGTMTNTLVLAYIGGSLTLSLLLIAYSNSIHELLNQEQIVVEILQAIIGSIGLLCAIPLTCVFAAYLFCRGTGGGPLSRWSRVCLRLRR